MSSTTPTTIRIPGWKLVLDAFLAAPGRTLTNVELGAIPGVQAFHQRISDCKRAGYVFTEGVLVRKGHYAYQLIGRREGTDATGPLPLLAEHEVPEARARAVASLKENPPATPTLPDSPVARAVTSEMQGELAAEVRGLTERNAELEAENARLGEALDRASGNRDGAPVTEGALYIVFDGPPDHDAPHFVEVEDVDGAGTRTLAEWEQHPHSDSGLWRLGPFYAQPQAPARAPRPRREPRTDRLTGPQAMAQVLEAEGKPMHSKRIAERVLAEHPDLYGGKTPAATMAAQLATSNVKGADFVKVSPGCFGLRAWDAAKLAQEPTR